ncbi:hypothetical protein DMUE_2869 [Dictyocoela muelleri]|nr:hypothetical protein DMUE_2869 [Dictyocoela muelleri]
MIYNLNFITRLRDSTQETISFLCEKGILRTSVYCDSYSYPLKTVAYKISVDGKAFICYRKSCVDFLKYLSLRKNSFFEGIKVPLGDCLLSCTTFFLKNIMGNSRWIFRYLRELYQS